MEIPETKFSHNNALEKKKRGVEKTSKDLTMRQAPARYPGRKGEIERCNREKFSGAFEAIKRRATPKTG